MAAGDAIWDSRLLADALRDPPWDAVRFDVSFVGGFTPTRELMSVAERAGMDVELISYGHTVIQAANLHAALALGEHRSSSRPCRSSRWSTAPSNRSALDLTGWRAYPRDRGSASTWTRRRSRTPRSASFEQAKGDEFDEVRRTKGDRDRGA